MIQNITTANDKNDSKTDILTRMKTATENSDTDAMASILKELARDPAMAEIIERILKVELDHAQAKGVYEQEIISSNRSRPFGSRAN